METEGFGSSGGGVPPTWNYGVMLLWQFFRVPAGSLVGLEIWGLYCVENVCELVLPTKVGTP